MQNRFYLILFFAFIFLVKGTYGFSGSDEYPKRIISLAPSLTKNIYLLGAGNKLVGCTNYCSLQADTNAEIVANAIQVNYEQIVLLKPDLIITTNLTKSRTIETFKKLGLKILVFENPKNFGEICDQFLELGRTIGKHQQAIQIIEEAQNKIDLIRSSIPASANDDPTTVFMQLGANPLFAVVPGSFMNDYMVLSSTKNIVDDLKTGSVNLESVLMRDPAVIFIVLMGIIGSEELKKWKSFDKLKAVENNRIYTIDADKACSPTPLSFVETLEEIIKYLYVER
jgi:iron complex transport system substrate-binding protein